MGNPLQYRCLSTLNAPDTYDLWSLGPDGREGTADDIRDLLAHQPLAGG